MIEIKTAQGWRPLFAVCVNSNKLEGVFRPTSLEVVREETSERADVYCAAIQGWIDGDDFGTKDMGQRWQAMWRASGQSTPLYGAYGEKL